MLMIFKVLLCYAVAKESSEKFKPEQESNPDLYDATAMLSQLNYQANWELVVMSINDELVDSRYLHMIKLTKFHLKSKDH